MAKYLLKASYTPDGTKGLLKEGGSSRKTAVQNAISSLGGKSRSTKGTTENRVKLYGKHEENTKTATTKHCLHKPIGLI
jgi:hypothetical protein